MCCLSVLFGIWIRNHHLFTPRIADQIKELTDAGFSPDDARAWVAYTNSGLLIGGKSVSPEKGSGSTAATISSVLFASEGKADVCGLFTAEHYKNQEEQINALKLQGGVWDSYASFVAHLDMAGRNAALGSAQKLFCH